MKSHLIVGLTAGLALAATAVTAQAEPGKGAGKGQAMQIMIDKKSGRKITADDSSESFAAAAASAGIAPMADYPEVSIPTGKNVLGTEAATVGSEHHKYLVMSIDENGQRHIDHKSKADIDAGDFEVSKHTGDHQ